MATATDTHAAQEKRSARHAFVQGVHGVRYQVKDVARSVTFYTTHLGFTLEHQQLPAFASVSLGEAQMLLSGPQASGSSIWICLPPGPVSMSFRKRRPAFFSASMNAGRSVTLSTTRFHPPGCCA